MKISSLRLLLCVITVWVVLYILWEFFSFNPVPHRGFGPNSYSTEIKPERVYHFWKENQTVKFAIKFDHWNKDSWHTRDHMEGLLDKGGAIPLQSKLS